VDQFQTEGKALGDAHRDNSAQLRAMADETASLQAQIQNLDRELRNQPAQQRREAQLEQALADAEQAAGLVDIARAELSQQEERLRTRDFAPEQQAELARLAAELTSISYDANAHEQSQAEAGSLAEFEDKHRDLLMAQDQVDQQRMDVEKLQAQQRRWRETLADDLKQRDNLAAEVERLPEIEARVQSGAQELEEAQAQSSRARMELGAAQQKLDHCHRLAEERVRHETNRKQRSRTKAVYEELRLAFGKKGIQAMIIESAIPEIETEANRLLSRMTNNRMHVRLETQRETLKGDTVETLDINIADELGTRSYELFSGGEAFRVNFAIRIALSKLLARRAGAQLEVLVIDEGFGTQDAEGRERLVEAINSIQDDFARILVVTHIEELKDAFPVWIEVTKTENGSQFRLS
jgi:exonuclease SbcC